MIHLSFKDSLDAYHAWERPTAIVSDGPYGINGYDGDLREPAGLAAWYTPHAEAWSRFSTPLTTLWFWNTEVGWANCHPMLERMGWVYRGLNVWDKGISHIAGNCNTQTMRKFPVVTEVCAHYIRKTEFKCRESDGTSSALDAQAWLRKEWNRACIPLSQANAACGVRNAATRKYLTKCHLWYFPPAAVFEKLAAYANLYGKPEGRPYFSLNGETTLLGSQWEKLRAKFKCPAGVTNVWSTPAVRGAERIKSGTAARHPNQKPQSLMDRIIVASTDPGDVVWEPFGGLCSASISASNLGRRAYAAEVSRSTYEAALLRASSPPETRAA